MTDYGRIKVKTDYDKCPYIDAGRVYLAEPYGNGLDNLYRLVEDQPTVVITLNETCPHLNNVGHWEVVEDDYSYERVKVAANRLFEKHINHLVTDYVSTCSLPAAVEKLLAHFFVYPVFSWEDEAEIKHLKRAYENLNTKGTVE